MSHAYLDMHCYILAVFNRVNRVLCIMGVKEVRGRQGWVVSIVSTSKGRMSMPLRAT